LVNEELAESHARWLICVYPATAQELLVILHRTVGKRRFLAIGFFETDSRGDGLINIDHLPRSDPARRDRMKGRGAL
jgi:hypothetical protein